MFASPKESTGSVAWLVFFKDLGSQTKRPSQVLVLPFGGKTNLSNLPQNKTLKFLNNWSYFLSL